MAAVEAEVEPGVEDEVQPTLVTPDRGKRKRHAAAGASSKKPAMSSASVAVGVGGIEKS